MLRRGLWSKASGFKACWFKKLELAQQSQLDTVILNESGLNPLVWENELIGDVDRDFLLKGIFEGFDIVDDNVKPLPAECNNYLSATDVSVNSVVVKGLDPEKIVTKTNLVPLDSEFWAL